MRAAIVATLILLLPAALFAAPTLGVYFTYNPGQMTYSPVQFEQFNAYIFAQGTQCYFNAAEFQLGLPAGVVQMGFTVPTGALTLGDPVSGFAVTYWPPMDGWNPGYNLVCTVQLFATIGCQQGLIDAPVTILPNPGSGLTQGSCWPENALFPFAGLTSILCPSQIGVQEKSWGAIKELF